MTYEIAFLGPKATFTDLAVSKLFPDANKIPMPTILDCLDAVEKGEVELALVPIENALEGSVNITIDYLTHEAQLPIRGEIIIPIQQHYMVHPNHSDPAFKPDIVYSHSHAIAQCHKFLHRELKGIPYEYTTSTAAAAKMVKENPERKIAAIANEMAAEEYGLVITNHNIHDYSHNHTKFVVVSHKDVAYRGHMAVEGGKKTTLMVTLPADYTGALHQVLSAFAWRKLNLSKIESRPMKTGLGDYLFIIDVEMAMDEVLIPGTIAELEALGCKVSVLGSYPSFSVKSSVMQK
ncbi:prephenate dehydratase [Peribacillus huizhouensis]|uniref:Prephenate dehydratase n=1 Tax=Peribacillus huizhouensis TaxID=1501239 RepID=A0ABR6CL11_9BACI|nr:prephenate dehydratase [Peribacillus huizhouensis]MBA9025715.1 prephenate dehydratase [Peribacillus huizhouensis]